METQQSLTGVSAPIRSQQSISSLSNSVETPDVNPAGILALLRLLFALSLVVLTAGGRRLSGAEAEIVSAILWGYLFYSAALCTSLLARLEVAQSANHYSAWIDLCCGGLLVFVTKGTSPILFGGFWLAVLTANYERSRYLRLVVGAVAALILAIDLFFNFGSITFPVGVHPKLTETIALICSPMILGILVFYWGRQRSILERRVGLLLDVSAFSNPRFGAEWCLSTLMEKVRAFYQADGCLFIDFLEGDSGCRIHRRGTGGGASAFHTENISRECTGSLLMVPDTFAFVLSPAGMPVLRRRYIAYDVLTKERSTSVLAAVESLSTLLEAESIISVPMFQQNRVAGRIFLTSNRKRFFSAADTAFLSQFIQQYLPLIENLRLVDNLTTAASDLERKHIALDMHDNVVQPYIGIQLGLSAIRRKVQAGRMDISEDLEKLATMAQVEVSGLRRYMVELSAEVKHNAQFLPAVRRLTEKFAATTGIAVEVKTSKDIHLNDKLAAEAFQMIAEGLSNIRRHTAASEAIIEIDCNGKHFHLRIANNGRNGNGNSGEFVPKSITSRAASLGGEVHIDLNTHGQTTLNIGIPF
jgi:signal transduction histidine kinase